MSTKTEFIVLVNILPPQKKELSVEDQNKRIDALAREIANSPARSVINEDVVKASFIYRLVSEGISRDLIDKYLQTSGSVLGVSVGVRRRSPWG